MKKHLVLSGAVIFSSVFAVSSFAQDKKGTGKPVVIHRLKSKKGTFDAKVKHNSRVRQGKVMLTYASAGQACATEGERAEDTTAITGTCTVLGQSRSCECEVTVTFECKEGAYQSVKTSIGVCTVNASADVPKAFSKLFE